MKLKHPLLCVLASAIAVVNADEFDSAFDDAFSDDAFADVVVEDSAPSAFSLDHQLNIGSTIVYRSDETDATETLWSGVTSARASYQPSFRYTPSEEVSFSGEVKFGVDGIFWLRENDGWSDADIDNRQYRVDVKELLAQYRLNNWQLSSGVQNVTLGLADALSVANVLYAQNISEPGATDIDDTLQPAWTSMAAGSLAGVRVKIGSVHAHEVNQLPVAGTDFATPEMSMVSVDAEELNLSNSAWFASVAGVIGAVDWQLNAVSQLAHSPTLELAVLDMGPPRVIAPVAIHYPRQTVGSAAVSLVTGSFLWKAEAALTDGLQAQSFPNGMPGPIVSYQRAAGTFGFDFDHSTLGRLVAEIQVGYIPDFDSLNLPDSAMAPSETSLQWALIYRQSLLREQLAVTAQIIGFDLDSSGGRMQGLGAEYDVSDTLSVSARVLDYVSGSYAFLQGADDRDRLMLGAQYRF